jgi:hypothetical protein
MPRQLLRKFSKVTLIDQLISQLQQTINLNADGAELPFSGFVITSIHTDEIHFQFSISGRSFICSMTWQKFLANQVFVNQIKFN